VRHLVVGLVLTAGLALLAGRIWGWDAGVVTALAGLLATGIESCSVTLLRRALDPPFERLLKRWALGLGLRLGGLALVVGAVVLWPRRFPVLPTAVGFLAVLIPLMLGEMWLVWTKLRTTR
jgi:hypothetical protein